MLRLTLSDKVESFRNEFREWLSRNPPPQAPGDTTLATFQRIGRQWQATLASGGWLGTHWPEPFGGRGLSLVEEAVVQEELVRAESPQVLGLFGLTMVGPVLIRHGTDAQRKRFLARILEGSDIWCQGFSEPNAGSDLANVKTRAVRGEGGFLLTGQKVWTSFAHIADWCFVLCRTSDSAVKHEGLSYLLVDMRQPGITVRPLRQASGDEEFNEVFFDNVPVPDENLVGAQGEGWKIAISTLMYERVVLTFARQLQSERALRQLLQRKGLRTNAVYAKELASRLAEACAVRALAYEHLLEYSAGGSPGAEGSLDKLLWSESFQRITSLAFSIDGARAALGQSEESSHQYLYSRGRTIAAGTSEIQRNIIAERILRLPRARVSLARRGE